MLRPHLPHPLQTWRGRCGTEHPPHRSLHQPPGTVQVAGGHGRHCRSARSCLGMGSHVVLKLQVESGYQRGAPEIERLRWVGSSGGPRPFQASNTWQREASDRRQGQQQRGVKGGQRVSGWPFKLMGWIPYATKRAEPRQTGFRPLLWLWLLALVQSTGTCAAPCPRCTVQVGH